MQAPLSVTFGSPKHGVPGVSVRLDFEPRAGRLECIRATVEGPVTTTTMRRLNIGSLVIAARGQLVRSGSLPTVPRVVSAPAAMGRVRARGQAAGQLATGGKRGRPTKYGPDFYEKVAAEYLAAWSSGRKVIPAVMRQFRTESRTQAAKWVAKARQLGLLDPTTRGKPSGRSQVVESLIDQTGTVFGPTIARPSGRRKGRRKQ